MGRIFSGLSMTQTKADSFYEEKGNDTSSPSADNFFEDTPSGPPEATSPEAVLQNPENENINVPNIYPNLTTGQKVARGIVKAPWINYELEDLANATLDPNNPVLHGIRRFNETLPMNWGDEHQAALDTAADALSGHIPSDSGYFKGLLDDYRFNRDLRRKQLELGASQNPGLDLGA